MKNMKPLAFAVAALLAAMAPASAQIVTKYSGIQPIEHPSSYAEKYFGEEVGLLTNGTVKVEVYHNTQLGDAVANVQSVRNGTIGFTTVSASNLNQVVPAMDMYSLPFLFKNEAQFWWFLAQPQAAELAKPLEAKGIKILAYIDSGSRNFFTQKAVRTPDDLKGQKIRVMASPVMVNTMKSLGATGVPVAWAELYTALQTGVVDGAENNHPSVVAKKFYEVSKFYTLDEHMRIPDVLIMSMKLWNQLNDEQKKAVIEAGARAQAYMRGAWNISEVKDLQALKSNFTEIIVPDKAPFVKAVSGLVDEEAKRLGRREDRRLHPRFAKELLSPAIDRAKRGGRPPPRASRGRMPWLLDLLDRFAASARRRRALGLHRSGHALFLIVVVAVVARYGFGQAVSWTEEVPRYLLIWISFLAAAVGVLQRDHVGFDVLFNALPKGARRVLGVALSVLIFGFGWIVFRYGIDVRPGFRRRPDGDDPLHQLLVLPGDADLRLPDDGVRLQAHGRRDRAAGSGRHHRHQRGLGHDPRSSSASPSSS